jgi:hypothetical protein
MRRECAEPCLQETQAAPARRKMNKRKNSDESVIFEHRKWPKTGKNPGPDSALVSSSERGRGDATKRRGVWLPFLDVFRTRARVAEGRFGVFTS